MPPVESATLEAEAPVVPEALSPEATARLEEVGAQFSPAPVDAEVEDGADDFEDEGDAVEEADWRTSDDVKELMGSLGWDAEKLSRVASREALDAAALFHDEQLAALGKSLLEQRQAPPESPAGSPAPKTESAAVRPVTPPASPAPLANPVDPSDPFESQLAKIAALDDEYDPVVRDALQGMAAVARQSRSENVALRETVGKLEQFANMITQQMQAQQQQAIQQHQMQVEREFKQHVGALGHNDLFGDDPAAEELPDAQFANLKKVWDQAMLLHTAESHRAGQMVPITKGLVTRAFNSVFADKLTQKALAEKNAKLQQQSRRKLGGATRKVRPPQPKADLSVPASEDPVFMAKIAELRERHERGDS